MIRSPSMSPKTTSSASTTSDSVGTAPPRRSPESTDKDRQARVAPTMTRIPSVDRLGDAAPALRPSGDRHRAQDRQTDEPLVPIGRHADEHEPVLQDGEQRDAKNRAEYGTHPPTEA